MLSLPPPQSCRQARAHTAISYRRFGQMFESYCLK
jgi:hypothetical protein